MFNWLKNLFVRKTKGMDIQFRILKAMGPNQYLVHLATPIIKTQTDPERDNWHHLGVIVMDGDMISQAQIAGLNIIWTRD